ncbi:MAG: chromate efflux transporter [Betaproteobacteria bacterium]|nr:chromate efflux transporter [Betaproteobacteria bacterium]
MDAPETPKEVSFAEACGYWLKLGFISFGGPAGQIAMMHQELVERRRWISERRFLHALNYCMVLPGPEAQQLATYIGWLMHRTWGGIVAGGLFVLPSLFILIALTWIYMAYSSVPAVAGLLYGIKPAVVAIVLAAAWRIGSRALRHPALWTISASAFAAIYVAEVPFPAIVIGAGLIGAVGGRLVPKIFSSGGGHGSTQKGYGPALIDDDTPTPEHARYRLSRVAGYACAGLAIWLASMLALVEFSGWTGTLFQIGWFFTKAALLTFGGAYAVLPYVYQGAVEQHQWLTATQMIDGLALGETTPGPLIMVVAFVGFVGGWTKALFGPESLFLAGAAAASVATFFTFLPSFVFILVGGPLVESTHGDLKFTAPLTGITAAVVGVIVSLALFFAKHVFWPQGFAGTPGWISMALAGAALAALVRFKAGLIPLILAMGGAGLLLRLSGLA